MYYSEEETSNFKKVFSLIAPTVEKFANEHQLFIEKYYYGGPNWTLVFGRKIGGVAQIYMNYLSDNNFIIRAMWYVDEVETETRHAKNVEIGTYTFNNDLEKLSTILNKALSLIKSWSLKDLDVHHGDMTQWGRQGKTKEYFEEEIKKRYPILDV